MCIMASPVQSVTDTKIFVGRDDGSSRQLTVYEMSVQLQGLTGKGNAMILPVPVSTAGASSIELHDLSSAPDFFKPFVDVFAERSRGFSMNKSRGMDDALEVVRVGNYDVSVVPSVNDVKRLNTAVFDVSADTERTLSAEYALGFAFVVAQLRASGDFHPLAYTHPYANALFVPTRHEHGRVGAEDDLPKWDHQIFYQGSARPVQLQHLRNTASTRTVDEHEAQYCVLAVRHKLQAVPTLTPFIRTGLPLSRIRAQGRLPNVDLLIAGA